MRARHVQVLNLKRIYTQTLMHTKAHTHTLAHISKQLMGQRQHKQTKNTFNFMILNIEVIVGVFSTTTIATTTNIKFLCKNMQNKQA